MNKKEICELVNHARTMRKDSTKMFYKWGHGHFGGSFSAVDIIATLYFHTLNVDPQNPEWNDRDRFILSKGHAAAPFYSALCQKGYFPCSFIEKYGELCANLNTHPSMHRVPGVDMSSGSLGHGLPIGVGIAYAAKMDYKGYLTYILLGDGECNEGMIWESALAASKFKLDNIVAIIDRNHMCIAGNTEEWMPLEPFSEKWKAFNWDVYEIDGHNFLQLTNAFDTIKKEKNGKPKVVIANTIKGKCIKFMENNARWHSNSIDETKYKIIIEELDSALEEREKI